MQPIRRAQQISSTHRPLGKGSPEPVRIRLLGGFSASVGSRILEEGAWRLRKAASLVKLLALSSGHRLHREQVMAVLWPDLGRQAASNNLRGVIHAARRTLVPDPVTATRYLRLQGEHIALCPSEQLRVDVEAFEETAAAARRSKDPAAYRTAIELYAGELLPEDRYEEWAETRREELRQLHLALLVELAGLYEERGEHEPAVEALRRVEAEEPTMEEAHTSLMRIYALSGWRGEAIAQYGRLHEILSSQLGAKPSAATHRLRDMIAVGGVPPAHLVATQPEEPSDTSKHNLPASSSSFVGREREIVEVKRLLAMTRLLTLTGAGGSGKTRLALEVARDLVGVYPNGVWLVELAPLTEGALVPQVVAEILGVHEQPNRRPTDTLVNALKTKEILLILDNCEHLVEICASLVDALLAGCPRLKVLATSRESLGVAGEAVWVVSSLSVPHTDRLPETRELTRFDAVRLFVDRARLRMPDFDLTSANGRVVVEVCTGLEGMPLAIELATARMGALAVKEVAQRLEDSLSLLTAGPRTVAPRQRTIRATLEWSHGLLSEAEQVLFRRLSPFAGGWTLDAAEAVGSDGIERRNILDLLSRLVDKSLVVAEVDKDGSVRYRMLEPLRQYARERLEKSREYEAVHPRHAQFFLALAERAEPELKGSVQAEWLERLEADNDNLRAAMAWLLEKGEVEAAVRMAWALWIFLLIHGHQSEARRWIEVALDKGEYLPARARAKALVVQATTYYGLGSPEQLERLCREAATLFRLVGDKRGLAYTLVGQAYALMQRGDAERAIALFEESYPLAREAGDKWAMCGGLVGLGSTYLGLGDYEQAAPYLEEALALSREIGNKFSESSALYGLALAEYGRDDHKRATELYAEGLKASAEAGDKANIAYCLEGLAQLAVAQGESERAARLFGAAEASLEAAGGVLYAYVQDRSLHDQAVDAIRSRLDETSFSAAWAEGGAMSLGEAVEYALSGEEAAPPVSLTAQQQPSTAAQPFALTRREQEVAALVARGLTNRQTAAELSISEHTVATHVGKTMRKLGLSSRSQLAVWVAEQQGRPSLDSS